MIDKRQQISNAVVYMTPLLIGNLMPIITLPIFTRLLSREDYGALALANAYAVVVAGVVMVGLPIAYDRNFFEYSEGVQRPQLLYSVVGFTLVAFSICGLATWALRDSITHWLIGDSRYQQVVVWSMAATAVVSVKAFYLTYLRNSEQAKEFSAYTIAERLLAAIFTLLLVAWARFGVVGLVIGQLMASLAVFAVVVVRFLRKYPPMFNRVLLADSLKLGYPLMPRVLLGVLGNNFDKYLIGQIASLGGVGVYSIGQRVASIAFSYMTALQNVFGPRTYTRMFTGGPEAGRSIGQYLTPFAYASTVLAFSVAVFSEEILRILTPSLYHGAVPIVTILALSQGILFFGKIPQITFARKTYLISILAAFGTVLNVVMTAAGIWLWGTVGAAWGMLAAGAILTTVSFMVGQRCFRIEWEARKMVAIFGLFAASALVALALQGLEIPYAVRAATKVAAVAAFAWLGVRFGYLSAANIALVREMIVIRIRPRRTGA